MSWKSNKLTALLGIHVPIIQAPMAGSSTPELAAAVTNAGKGDFMSLYSGQSAALSRALPAADLVETLVTETDEALAGLG